MDDSLRNRILGAILAFNTVVIFSVLFGGGNAFSFKLLPYVLIGAGVAAGIAWVVAGKMA